MKKVILYSLLLLFTQQIFTQNWIEPVNVSNMEGTDQQPHFCIDNEGVIHCVWEHVYENNFSKIFYSKSYDDGLTWAEPENVSLNDEKRLSTGHIVVDSENHLHLTYNYNTFSPIQTQVHYKMFEGTSWSDTFIVSEDLPECHHNRLVIDQTDRIYIFWIRTLYQNGTTFYRYMENGVWSEILIPYDNEEFWAFGDYAIDQYNNIHWIGGHHTEEQSTSDIQAIYFHYDYDNDSWSGYVKFGEYHTGSGFDIDINNLNNPSMIWQEFTNENIPPNDGTFYTFFDEEQWSNPELIVEDPKSQQIIIDENNNANLFDVEKLENGSMLVHYTKNSGLWEGNIVDESDWFGMSPYVDDHNDSIYIIYQKPIGEQEDGEVFFIKSDILDKVNNRITSPTIDFKLSPNPFSQKVRIEYKINETNNTIIKIYSLTGQLIKTLYQGKIEQGEYQIFWDGTTQSGTSARDGTYLIRIRVGNKIKTKSVELIR